MANHAWETMILTNPSFGTQRHTSLMGISEHRAMAWATLLVLHTDGHSIAEHIAWVVREHQKSCYKSQLQLVCHWWRLPTVPNRLRFNPIRPVGAYLALECYFSFCPMHFTPQNLESWVAHKTDTLYGLDLCPSMEWICAKQYNNSDMYQDMAVLHTVLPPECRLSEACSFLCLRLAIMCLHGTTD